MQDNTHKNGNSRKSNSNQAPKSLAHSNFMVQLSEFIEMNKPEGAELVCLMVNKGDEEDEHLFGAKIDSSSEGIVSAFHQLLEARIDMVPLIKEALRRVSYKNDPVFEALMRMLGGINRN